MISNGIVAFASGLYAQYQGFADVNAGRGAIVIGLAAVIIGEVVFGKISQNFGFKPVSYTHLACGYRHDGGYLRGDCRKYSGRV